MVKNWWDIQVLCDPALEDTVFWRFELLGALGTSSQRKANQRLFQAYFPQNAYELLDVAAIALLLRQDALCAQLPQPQTSWGLIDEEDWSKSWKQYWHPQDVGDRLLINPAWLPTPETDRKIIKLDPGVAFGTGAHATTHLDAQSRWLIKIPGTTSDQRTGCQAIPPTPVANFACTGDGLVY